MADKSIQKHYTSALNKIKTVLRSQQKEQLEDLNENMKVQVPDCARKDYDYLSNIQHAISARNILEIEYKNIKEEESRRKIEPIGLIFYAFDWHMIGWCHTRQDYRDFKVSRIVKMKNIGLPFSRAEHIPVAEYMKQLPVSY